MALGQIPNLLGVACGNDDAIVAIQQELREFSAEAGRTTRDEPDIRILRRHRSISFVLRHSFLRFASDREVLSETQPGRRLAALKNYTLSWEIYDPQLRCPRKCLGIGSSR